MNMYIDIINIIKQYLNMYIDIINIIKHINVPNPLRQGLSCFNSLGADLAAAGDRLVLAVLCGEWLDKGPTEKSSNDWDMWETETILKDIS